jgi:FkbM family methyltransferase
VGVGLLSKLRRSRKLIGPKILAEFAATYPQATFVEIGANDGVKQDHLRPFITSSAWTGVLVEPLPWVFERLRHNYQGQEGITFENAAISGEDGRVPFFYVPPENGDWSDMIGSLSRFEVERAIIRIHNAFNAPAPDVAIECTEVRCLTFESLCRKHGIERLDLLLIDAEGHDWEIVKGIDFERHRPRLMIFESNHLSAADQRACRAHLEGFGYSMFDEGIDTWCLHSSAGLAHF